MGWCKYAEDNAEFALERLDRLDDRRTERYSEVRAVVVPAQRSLVAFPFFPGQSKNNLR